MRTKLLSSIAALVVIVGAGSYGTFAAFTDTTQNAGNSFAAGNLELAAEGTAALLTLSGLAPGDAIAPRCIRVFNDGTLTPDTVALTATVGGAAGGPDEDANGSPDGDGLQDDLQVTIERSATGTPGTTGTGYSCIGFGGTVEPVYAGTLSAFSPPAPDTTGWAGNGTSWYYRISGSVPAGTVTAAEGDTATLTLTWTATT